MQSLLRGLRLTLAIWLLTVVVVTTPMLVVAQLLVPHQANGSLLRHQGAVVGSSLIGQSFSSARYLQGRPSAVNDAAGAQPSSGASNLSAANPQLRQQVADRQRQWEQRGVPQARPDLLTSSGSGLDPHISLEAALQQAPLVARARGLSVEAVTAQVSSCSRKPLLGLFGAPLVPVLSCNLALDVERA
jgi:K+-transporting ATPase ATPase C chain